MENTCFSRLRPGTDVPPGRRRRDRSAVPRTRSAILNWAKLSEKTTRQIFSFSHVRRATGYFAFIPFRFRVIFGRRVCLSFPDTRVPAARAIIRFLLYFSVPSSPFGEIDWILDSRERTFLRTNVCAREGKRRSPAFSGKTAITKRARVFLESVSSKWILFE